MGARLPRVFTIAPGAPFLEILADQVLRGFPLPAGRHNIADWTILLPTRRATRVFAEILLRKSGSGAMLLPRVRPIGDLEEDLLAEDMAADGLQEPMLPLANLLELVNLAKRWAGANLHVPFAAEILASPTQALALAQSLVEFITTVETQGCDITRLEALYGVELAAHRETVIGLLQLVMRELPAIQHAEAKTSAAVRRNALIRAEAERISKDHTGPIIAAGSTGTIPATRALLKAIASHDEGAVILPGLDLTLDDASWNAIAPEHPQYAMKLLVEELGVARKGVTPLGPENGPRSLFLSELFRPTETAACWHEVLPGVKTEIEAALAGLAVITAENRHREARAIALILRETLATPGKTAALVTPDRDLALRVSHELLRWKIDIADSAGQKLAGTGLGAALGLLLEAIQDGFSPQSLMAFLRHPAVNFGKPGADHQKALSGFEVAVLRGPAFSNLTWSSQLARMREGLATETHPHPLVATLNETDWTAIAEVAAKADALVAGFHSAEPGLARQIANIENAFALALGEAALQQPDIARFFDDVKSQSHRAAAAPPAECAEIMQAALADITLPSRQDSHPRIVILGTLEARLMPADVVILGGLNEGVWPQQADTGPWLNRTMRQALGLPQPERDIGLAAHDFEQGLASAKVYLTSSRRTAEGPAQASRWLLRLQTVLAAAGLKLDSTEAQRILRFAAVLDQADDGQKPVQAPSFAPPVASRPTRFSVTDVEKLIRNPYAIYARKVLKLEPLKAFAEAPANALRGQIFHQAIGEWNKAQAQGLEALLAEGEKAFASLGNEARERKFWWPHFRRLAQYLAQLEQDQFASRLRIHAEASGRHEFEVDGIAHMLTARADRIDVLENGSFRLIDYKSGGVPSKKQVTSGLSPQLTLEAHLLLAKGFALAPNRTDSALYVAIGSGRQGLKVRPAVEEDKDVNSVAQSHFSNLCRLLGLYRNPEQAYLPRLREISDEDVAEYDHLSRYLEWQLAGGRA